MRYAILVDDNKVEDAAPEDVNHPQVISTLALCVSLLGAMEDDVLVIQHEDPSDEPIPALLDGWVEVCYDGGNSDIYHNKQLKARLESGNRGAWWVKATFPDGRLFACEGGTDEWDGHWTLMT